MAKNVENTKLEPANLSFRGSVEPTPGIMFGVAFNGPASFENLASAVKAPVNVTLTTARGTIGNDDKATPEQRLGLSLKSIAAANLSSVEEALLPADTDYLLLAASIRFTGQGVTPCMCSEPQYREKLDNFMNAYIARQGFDELALRYMLNIATGAWLWRNRHGEDLQVSITHKGVESIFTEDDIDMSTAGFTLDAVVPEKREAFSKLVSSVSLALSGQKAITLHLKALVRMGYGANVYPSQEAVSEATHFIRYEKNEKPSKVLSKQRNADGTSFTATIHARKIGNAIRTIDTWHGVDGVGAIAIDVYAADTYQHVAHRLSGNNLYDYLRNPDELLASIENEGVTGKHHYVAACLARGGVYGFASSAKKKNQETTATAEA